MERFQSTEDPRVRSVYSKVLSNRLEYLLLKLLAKDDESIKVIIEQVVSNGQISDIIGFLNKNNNIELENEIIAIVRRVCEKDQEVKHGFCTYLEDRIVEKMGYEKIVPPRRRREEELDRGKVASLAVLLTAILLLFPALYVWNHFDQFAIMTIGDHIRVFIVDLIYYMTFYVIAANLVYIILLMFSLQEVSNQAKYWKVKGISFLFKKGILPSISIIAPAYGEEATIIESSKSLLGLNYPDFQLVVVNDGSPDNTLKTLIDYYGLEKVDMIVNERLKTQPIRGLYTNPSYPSLVVVDKANGGKADALNVGINVASKDYICCIDADSLLEPTALLKVASRSLDYEEETVATGGNIMPINGCTVDRGILTQVGIPKNHLARVQTVEYLRAFMAGRLGWTYLNALLIISGAFGLFKRSRVLEIGGYLTSSERYEKDTVGEDMELVVRLSRHMRESKIPYRVQHAYNANCWTEVPEDFSILKKQRDRWHRGLIDIMHFHRRILFRPLYGSMGLISFPYFLIFEVIGPFLEFIGYLTIVSQIIFNMFDWPIFLLLFSAIVLMGILVSMTGILIAEYKRNYFNLKETATLITYAFLENFGLRQIISFWRVGGYINSMKKPKGWGKMVRKGFTTQTNQGKQ
jgi:cellulose synthase/poly-beta-1,6-N-acetylglucosamine synthase-like glycosyltransferase